MSKPESDQPNPYASPRGRGSDLASLSGRLGQERPTTVRYGVVAALCMVAIVAYIQRNSISVAEDAIREETGLDKYAMGWIMSAFFWSYAVFQIPTALLGQWYGTRRVLSFFVALFSAVAGLFALVSGFPLLFAARVGMGVGQAGSFPCAVQSIAKWIPNHRRSISAGMLASCMSVGGAIGAVLTGAMLPYLGWRVTFAIFSLPGLILAVWFYWWFRDRPEEHESVNDAELDLIRHDVINSKSESSDLEQSPDVWQRSDREQKNNLVYAWGAIAALCGQQICRSAGYMFFTSWFATYLRETRGVKDLEVGLLNSLPLLAIVVGSPVGGLFADWVYQKTGSRRLSRQGIAAASMLICGIMILIAQPIADPWLAVLIISMGSFFAAFGGPCAYTATIDMGGRHTPVVFGTMNMMGNFGAAFFPIIVPWLLNEGDTPGSGNWNTVLFTFAGLYFSATVFWLLSDTQATIDQGAASENADQLDNVNKLNKP